MSEKRPASEIEAISRAVRILGGPVKVAAALDLSGYQVVQSWMANGVPAKYCPGIERLTADAGERVCCEEMFTAADWSYIRGTAPERAEA